MLNPLVNEPLSTKEMVVLIVEDDPISAIISTQALSDTYVIHHVSSGQAAVDFCESTPPDIVLMDLNMPGISGLQACGILKNNVITKDIPVVFITAASDPQSEDECWDAGCVDFISKPFSVKTLRHRINAHSSVKVLTDELMRLATSDALTQIKNRRFFDSYFLDQLKLAARNKTPIGLLLIDIDNFKQYNDNYGHIKGDECLKMVAAALAEIIQRPTDSVARYGGEEFVIVLPNTDARGIQHVGEHLIDVIHELNIEHLGSPIKMLTVSIGGALVEQGSLDAEKALERADKNLYTAKQIGRDRFVMD